MRPWLAVELEQVEGDEHDWHLSSAVQEPLTDSREGGLSVLTDEQDELTVE